MQVKGESPMGQRPFSPPLFPSPSLSGSVDGSSIASSASALVRAKPGPKGFKILDMWRPSIMAVINGLSDEDKAKKLSGELRSEIVRDLVTQMYAYTEKIDTVFCTDVSKKLVLKYPFMRDKGKGVSGYVSACSSLLCVHVYSYNLYTGFLGKENH